MRPWPGGVGLPARASSSVLARDGEATAPASAIPSGGDAPCLPVRVRTQTDTPSETARTGRPGAWNTPPDSPSTPDFSQDLLSPAVARHRGRPLQPVHQIGGAPPPHRERRYPGLLRHPRKSVDGIVRSNHGVIPRDKAENNTPPLARRWNLHLGPSRPSAESGADHSIPQGRGARVPWRHSFGLTDPVQCALPPFTASLKRSCGCASADTRRTALVSRPWSAITALDRGPHPGTLDHPLDREIPAGRQSTLVKRGPQAFRPRQSPTLARRQDVLRQCRRGSAARRAR